MVPSVTQVWIQLSHKNGVVTTVTKLNSLWFLVDWYTFASISEV
jgi:hypothetical protein